MAFGRNLNNAKLARHFITRPHRFILMFNGFTNTLPETLKVTLLYYCNTLSSSDTHLYSIYPKLNGLTYSHLPIVKHRPQFFFFFSFYLEVSPIYCIYLHIMETWHTCHIIVFNALRLSGIICFHVGDGIILISFVNLSKQLRQVIKYFRKTCPVVMNCIFNTLRTFR